jgi:hypothetical protein
VAVTSDSASQVKQFIYDELDLRSEHQHAEETFCWDDETAEKAERSYRDFLWVCYNFAVGETTMTWVSLLADKMGHVHLQDPGKFVGDCERIFGKGKVLLHDPLWTERRVAESDCDLAKHHYTELGLAVPGDLRKICIWAVVGN